MIEPENAGSCSGPNGEAHEREQATIRERARVDATGWRRRIRERNPEAVPGAQVIMNHYSMSRDHGHLGTVPRVSAEKQPPEFLVYRDVFLEVATAPSCNHCRICGDRVPPGEGAVCSRHERAAEGDEDNRGGAPRP